MTTKGELISNVADTSLWVATYRARESERPDALFSDPYARQLVGERGEEIANRLANTAAAGWSVVIRTVVIDRFIMEEISKGVDVIVNLGAGLDTRPYRMAVPADLLWIEADYPDVIAFKAKRLAGAEPRCRLERLAIDLSITSQRQEFLSVINARGKRILVLTEGVLPYLSNADVNALAFDLKTQPHFVLWIVDYFSPLFMKIKRRGKLARQLKNAPFVFSPGDWVGFFRAAGWELAKTRYLFDEAMRANRPPPTPAVIKFMLFFASKAKRRSIRQMMGYCLLRRGD